MKSIENDEEERKDQDTPTLKELIRKAEVADKNSMKIKQLVR